MSKHNLVSMKRTKQDKQRSKAEHVDGGESFPYGLAISLDDESLDKLGIKELPNVGEVWIVVGIGKVESVRQSSDRDRESRNVRIQLEKMEVGPLKTKKTALDAVSAAVKDA